ncbi:MAG: 23S rRNA (uracil(1939)-C(5))-methyltransferase RlmD [Ignavibacteriae bacterium]|nr:23S rRNA (uracil(1939)-C(5))-methyltransferase RlmD [Ignavibacteriota bacterium]MCB9216990.1 23S rRNA (uracil(1939)-C(5))-methyltransferase RlmD [Ignavibacteria bacterium]
MDTIDRSTLPSPLKKGSEVILTIESAAFNGQSVARYDGMAVFLTGCVPGDTVRAMVTKKKKSFAEARLLEVLTTGPERIPPRCKYFGDCGGCKWQNLEYKAQLYWKRQHVVDAFERIGGFDEVDVKPTLGCDEPFWYRNKMEFSFSSNRWLTASEIESGEEFRKDFALGLHAPGRFDKVIDVNECFLQSPESNRILNATRSFALDHQLIPYSTRDHQGFLRNLVIRTSLATGEIMVVPVTADTNPPLMDKYVKHIQENVPEVTTIVLAVNRKKAQVAFSEELYVLYGPGTITEQIAGNTFTISPFSFFQTNPKQGNKLYEQALLAADLTGEEKVWDLYCGAGTITLAAARQAETVVGVELNEGAVLDARANAVRNNTPNASFIAGDLKDVIAELEGGTSSTPRPDVVIVDPPRAGLHLDVVSSLLRLLPERICYVSCNPTTQARDCGLLTEAYNVEYIQPVDMFPQTYHIETVAKLVRKS